MKFMLSTGMFICCVCILACRKNSGAGGAGSAVELLWQKKFGGSSVDAGVSLVSTTEGGYVLVGAVQTTGGGIAGGHGEQDVWIAKVNASGDVVWSDVYGGSHEDLPRAIAASPDGGFVISGTTSSADGDVNPHSGRYAAWIFKIDGAGNLLWNKTVGSNDDPEDQFNGLTVIADGSIIVTGEIDSDEGLTPNPRGKNDLYVLKLGASGNTQWSSSFGGADTDVGKAIVATADGGYIIAGFTYSHDGDAAGAHGQDDLFVLKLDANGQKEWSRAIGGTRSENGFYVIQNGDGSYMVGGVSDSNDGDLTANHGTGDALICKLDPTGKVLWVKLYGGSETDALFSIAPSPGGGYVLAGFSQSANEGFGSTRGFNDAWIIGIDKDGNRQWTKVFGGSLSDEAAAIVASPDGTYCILGASVSADGDAPRGSGNYDIWLLKVKQ